jgi:hypothetical protein
MNILRDMYYHQGFYISSDTKLNEIEYDNKYILTENNNNLTDIKDVESITIMGIPFKIWYKSCEKNTKNNILINIGLYLNKSVSEVYITSIVYPQQKCLSFDKKLINQFIDIIGSVPDNSELREIEINYTSGNKNVRSENIFLLFDEFYWNVKKIIR